MGGPHLSVTGSRISGERRHPDGKVHLRSDRDSALLPPIPAEFMPFVIVHESGHPNRLFELPGPRITIGRSPSCELVLANVSVSRAHATLEVLTGGAVRVTPKASHNPVLVNDAPLEGATVLEHGSSMRLGKFKLTWMHEEHLDAYRMHQLEQMPRFSRLGSKDSQATYALSGAQQRQLLKAEALREFGSLTAADGTVYRLGTAPVSIGPDDAIPCDSRWGRRTAAVVQWGGSSHEITLTGMFAKMSINGTAAQTQVLQRDDTLTINGSEFTYGEVRKRS